MKFSNSAHRLESTIAGIATVLVCSGLACILATNEERTAFAITGASIGIAASILAGRIWGREPFRSYSITRWMCDAGISTLILTAFFLVDLVVGVIANPELPPFAAAQKHIGFLLTVFVTPVALVPLVGGLRAFLFLLLDR